MQQGTTFRRIWPKFKGLWLEALALGADTDHWKPPKFPAVFIAWLLLCAVSMLMLQVGDQINGEGMVITRYLARNQATANALQSYPSSHRDDIQVVLFDGEFLQSEGLSWPMAFDEHADVIDRITAGHGSIPKVLFIDLLFSQERPDQNAERLRESLCNLSQRGTRIYLAALPSPTLRLIDELMKGAGSCYTLVGVDYKPDPVDNIAWTYELSRPSRDQEGREFFYRSAAQAIAEDELGHKLGPENAHAQMALIWGAATPMKVGNMQDEGGSSAEWPCREASPSGWDLVPSLLKAPLAVLGVAPAPDTRPICPYHRHSSMTQILQMDEDTLSEHLGNKVIVLGAQIPGYNDFATSPVHGLIPGPFMHAMAIDNLMTFGSDYRKTVEWRWGPNKLTFATLALITVIFTISLMLKWLRHMQRTHLQLQSTAMQVLIEAFLWIGKMSILTMAALYLSIKLQEWLAIGLLPAIELVGMTLMAEGLGYLGWLHRQANREPH